MGPGPARASSVTSGHGHHWHGCSVLVAIRIPQSWKQGNCRGGRKPRLPICDRRCSQRDRDRRSPRAPRAGEPKSDDDSDQTRTSAGGRDMRLGPPPATDTGSGLRQIPSQCQDRNNGSDSIASQVPCRNLRRRRLGPAPATRSRHSGPRRPVTPRAPAGDRAANCGERARSAAPHLDSLLDWPRLGYHGAARAGPAAPRAGGAAVPRGRGASVGSGPRGRRRRDSAEGQGVHAGRRPAVRRLARGRVGVRTRGRVRETAGLIGGGGAERPAP